MSLPVGMTIRGWGVLHSGNLKLYRFFDTKKEAEACKKKLGRAGRNFVVRLGDNAIGTDDFEIVESNNAQET